jgi:hypothetical protein
MSNLEQALQYYQETMVWISKQRRTAYEKSLKPPAQAIDEDQNLQRKQSFKHFFDLAFQKLHELHIED